MKKYILVGLMMALASAGIRAQVTSVPYSMSFEDNETLEFANWVVNPGPQAANCPDEWVRGSALKSDGQKSLYLSNDAGVTSCFGGNSCIQFAYRDFILPDGHYYVSFDWIGGNPNASLRFGWYAFVEPPTPSQKANFNAVLGSTAWPNVGTNYQDISGATTWQNYSRQLDVQNPSATQPRTYRLYWAWVSNQVDSAYTYSIAIDNIQISDANCPRPENLSFEVFSCDSAVLAWTGSSSKYQVQYRQTTSRTWSTRTAQNGATQIVLQSMKEGNYDFRVRGICYEYNEDNTIDTLYSPYTYLAGVNVFCPDAHCVNYVNLTDTNVTRCYYGESSYSGYTPNIQSPFQHQGVIDQGWESVNSRHTVVWDTTATDPRTDNQLRMVPSGSSASVRLGNWNYNYGCEAITYDFYVDPDQSILLMNYAIVLENPSGHNDEEMPRFVLEIRDEYGNPLDPICGRIDLNPLNSDAGWNTAGSGYDAIVWKDWTMLGLNLDPYAGQKIQVCVITYDCFLGGHYGYAYFTFDCAAAHIKNTSCGASQNVEVEAPRGFNYTWKDSKTGTIRSSERSITIGLNDPTDWTCVLTNMENPDCYFELSVNTLPRYPVSEFSWTYEPKNCENRYIFSNSSFIRTNEDGQIVDHHDEKCDVFEWDFGFDDMMSDMSDPGVVVFPEKGGKYVVQLASMIGDGTGTCRSVYTDTIVVPAIGASRNRLDTAICNGNYVLWNGERYMETGIYTFFGEDMNGCELVDTLNLKVVDVSLTKLDTITICYGDTLYHDDDMFTKTVSSDWVIDRLNYLGCDSTVVQYVRVKPQIEPEYDAIQVSELVEYGSIEVLGSGYDYFTYRIDFDTHESAHLSYGTKIDSINGGGVYHFTFYNNQYGVECQETVDVDMTAACLRNLVFQRWDNVLSLKNDSIQKADNHGRSISFETYQWFKNGMPIPGANMSYYYELPHLEPGVAYACLVTYDGGQEKMTCDWYPIDWKTGQVAKPEAPAEKKLVNGTLVIVRDGAEYNSIGMRVK